MQPVVLGGDIGAYSLARTFHEAYGVRSVVVSGMSTGLVRHSRILRSVVEPRIEEPPAVVARLRAIAAEYPGRRLLLLASADWLVRLVVENREALEDLYTVPYTSRDLLDRATDKRRFSELCAELGIAHPRTVVHDVGAGGEPDTSGLRFPVIAKAASTAAYHAVEFAGKKKVFTVATRAELVALLDRVRAAGYTDAFVIQDFIPGDDSGMRILTCYCDRAGRVRFAGFGHVLLEEHTPGALGNPAGILAEPEPEPEPEPRPAADTAGAGESVVAQATRLLEHLGWTGYANFDLKYDPRDGRYVFFELNPRLGRSNLYLTAAGANTALFYVAEYLDGLDPDPAAVLGRPGDQLTREHLYTILPRPLLLRYVRDARLRARVRALGRARRVTNPLWYRAETDPRRLAYVAAAQVNQVRKYRRWYPVSAAAAQARIGASDPVAPGAREQR